MHTSALMCLTLLVLVLVQLRDHIDFDRSIWTGKYKLADVCVRRRLDALSMRLLGADPVAFTCQLRQKE